MGKDMNPEQIAHQYYLRRMVHHWQSAVNRRDSEKSASQNLYKAQQELKSYNNELRKMGVKA